MIQLSHLTINHQKDLHTLIEDLTLIVHPGDKLAIIGEEGTGKSTLMTYLHEPDAISSYAQVSGHYSNHFAKTCYIPQTLDEDSLQLTVSDYLYQDWEAATFDVNHLYQLAKQLQLPLPQMEDKEQLVGTLSGGEKLKLQLIKALASHPDLLLLDEPSSDLDLPTMQWLETFIKDSPLAILFISHDETFLSHTATRILHLERIQKRTKTHHTLVNSDYTSYKEQRQENYLRQLRLANKEREEHHAQMEKLNQHKSAVRHALTHTKSAPVGRLLAKKMKNLLSREQRFLREAETITDIPHDEDAISLFFSDITPLPKRKVVIHYGQKALETGQVISLDVFGEDKVVITGQNGIGKSLLLKQLLADLSQQTGLIIGYMPQTYDEAFRPDQTPVTFLEDFADQERIRTLLASIGFTRQELQHTVLQLSGGQKAKLYLAAMILKQANLLILDEPTRHFSPTLQPEVRELLAQYPSTLISVSHDRHFITDVGTKVLELTDQTLKPISRLGNLPN